jgi:uncharacterized protein YkwD
MKSILATVTGIVILSLMITSSSDDPNLDELMLYHNKQRCINDLDQFQKDSVLSKRAQEWANWMAKNKNMVHSQIKGTRFPFEAENIAYSYSDIDNVIEVWMNSEGHRANILNATYTHAGFGVSKSKDGTIFWCAQFGGKGNTK